MTLVYFNCGRERYTEWPEWLGTMCQYHAAGN